MLLYLLYTMTKQKKETIETQFKALEKLVDSVEGSGTNIDQAILDYQKALTVAKTLSERLKSTQSEVQTLKNSFQS